MGQLLNKSYLLNFLWHLKLKKEYYKKLQIKIITMEFSNMKPNNQIIRQEILKKQGQLIETALDAIKLHD